MRAGANVPVQIFNAVDPVRPSGGSPDGVGHTQRRDPALWPQARDCGARQRRGGAAAGGGERGAGVCQGLAKGKDPAVVRRVTLLLTLTGFLSV